MTTQADAGNKLFADETIKLIDKMENELAKAQMLIARQDRQIQQLQKATKTSDFEEGYLAGRVEQQVQPQQVLEDIEQYRMQMAGISTAAIGYWKEGDGIHPDYDTVALRDVAKLYAKYDALYKAQRVQPKETK